MTNKKLNTNNNGHVISIVVIVHFSISTCIYISQFGIRFKLDLILTEMQSVLGLASLSSKSHM